MTEDSSSIGVAQLFTSIPGDIAKALIGIQAEVQALGKTAKNDHFKNTYAPLDEVMDNALPLLSKHKLGLMQWPITVDDKHFLHTVLLHESGSNLQADIELLLVKKDPQGLGSAITYTRRQTVMAILGLSAKDEDDDGNKASNNLPPASAEQLETIIALCRDLKYPPEEVQKRLRSVRTSDHADFAIAKLEQVISGRAKQAAAKSIDVDDDSKEDDSLDGSPVDTRDTKDAVSARLTALFADNKIIREFIAATTGKPFIGNCKEADFKLLNEKLDRIIAGEESVPDEWLLHPLPEPTEPTPTNNEPN